MSEALRGFTWPSGRWQLWLFGVWIASRKRRVCDDTFVGVVDGYGMIMTLFYDALKEKGTIWVSKHGTSDDKHTFFFTPDPLDDFICCLCKSST